MYLLSSRRDGIMEGKSPSDAVLLLPVSNSQVLARRWDDVGYRH
jgi:hypothetical protein